MSEPRTSTIAEILDVREWDGPHGAVFYHKLKMSNGDIGEIGKKKVGTLTKGQELVYTIDESSYGNKFKEVKEDRQFGNKQGGGKSFGDPKSMILAFSKDVEVALIANGHSSTGAQSYAETANVTQNIIDRADAFLAWYEGAKPQGEHTVFSGDSMRPAEPHEVPHPGPIRHVVQGASPEIEAQRPTNDAQSVGDMITEKQLNLIRNVEKFENKDVEAICYEEMGCTVEELSKAAASQFIDILKPKK